MVQVHIRMSWFGGETQKPMQLFTNAEWLVGLQDYSEWGSRSSPVGTLADQHKDQSTGELRPRGGANLKADDPSR